MPDTQLDDVEVIYAELIDVHGALDWRGAGELRRRFTEATESAAAVIVDLSDVPSMDAAGTGAIVMVAVRANERGVRLAIVADHAPIPEILTSVGLPDMVPVVCDVEQARRLLSEPEAPTEEIPRTVFDELTKHECVTLLAEHHFGRLCVVADGQPIIFPVNYSSDGPNVVIQTALAQS